MTQKTTPAWSCKSNGGSLPVFATVAGVASCFAEAILQNHVALGSGFEIALALTQAVPFAIVLRYFAVRLSQSTGSTSAHNPE